MTKLTKINLIAVKFSIALEILISLFLLIVGLSFAMLVFVSGFDSIVTLDQMIFGLLGAFFVVVALFFFISAYGLRRGKRWAWTSSLILASISIGGSIIHLYITRAFFFDIIIIAVGALIIYFLSRPHIHKIYKK